MTRRTSLSLATVFSSAQCVLSVVGSVGVILLFAGIPQLIYSPVVSVANLMTFLVGAILITTMVAGNSVLNYKYKSLERQARERRRAQDRNGSNREGTDPEDKPPSYDAIITSDGLPPDYLTIVPEKPPRYEEIVNEIFTISKTTSQCCSTSPDITLPSTSNPHQHPPPSTSTTSTTNTSTLSRADAIPLPKVFHIQGAKKWDENQETTVVKSKIVDGANSEKKYSTEKNDYKINENVETDTKITANSREFQNTFANLREIQNTFANHREFQNTFANPREIQNTFANSGELQTRDVKNRIAEERRDRLNEIRNESTSEIPRDDTRLGENSIQITQENRTNNLDLVTSLKNENTSEIPRDDTRLGENSIEITQENRTNNLDSITVTSLDRSQDTHLEESES